MAFGDGDQQEPRSRCLGAAATAAATKAKAAEWAEGEDQCTGARKLSLKRQKEKGRDPSYSKAIR